MHRVFDRLAADVDAEVAVLIQGESGSGRRFVARRIHAESTRSAEPFLVHDCRLQGPIELRRKLFGEIRELAPGHYLKYMGLLEEVRRGTLYLEAVDGLDESLQIELARVLEERSFAPLGSDQSLPFGGRLIASSAGAPADRNRVVGRGSESGRPLFGSGITVRLERSR